MAKSKQMSQPSQQDMQALIAQLNSNQFALSENLATSLITKHPHIFMLRHILALALDGQQKYAQAVLAYQGAIKCQTNPHDPCMPDIWFNLGIALTQSNQLIESANAYLQAIKIKPNFFEAYGNLGTVYQRQGQLLAAIESYQAGIKINPNDARGHFNLGTALRDKGALEDAVKSYQQAISLFSNYTDAHNNLGETWRDLGHMTAAVKCYQAALTLNPNHANANYNMADFLYLAKHYAQALPYFERSQLDDWQQRQLVCLYKQADFAGFKQKLDLICAHNPHQSPFLATLAHHYSINFNTPNPYNYCKNSLDFVYKNAIEQLQQGNLLQDLLNDISNTAIAERKQGRLTNGQQSAGNLFKRPEASFRTLAELIKKEFLAYKNHFKTADCELIKAFPSNLEFTSSWYVKMQQGGHLSAHIHEIGWISGAVYLAMPTPTNGSNEGAFEYGMHGDDYPIVAPCTIDSFPLQHVMPNVGDIILFPSSLFHRTIPFSANQDRICIAFDLKPAD